MLETSIYLIGFMGAGKTSIGHALGEICNYPVIDTDEEIERQEQKAVRDIFAQFGEDYFRQLESQVLVHTSNKSAIITTGGGIILRKENRHFLKETKRTIFLQSSPEIVLERLKMDHSRPLMKDKSLQEISDMYDKRLPFYEECAHLTINTDHLSIEEAAKVIIMRMNL